ncbi:hypothetical protein EV182_005309, partial [Spiromyces aspiralis]
MDIKVLTCSWNIDALKPSDLAESSLDANRYHLKRWLTALSPDRPDILVVGLQEVVDLESKKMTVKSLWKSTTSKKNPNSAQNISKRYQLWQDALVQTVRRVFPDDSYAVLICHNLVGLFVCVFVRDAHHNGIQGLAVSQVKTGLGGLHGNKGGIGVRFVLYNTSFCFVVSHLAAGESDSNVEARDRHSATIIRNLYFRPLPPEYHTLGPSHEDGGAVGGGGDNDDDNGDGGPCMARPALLDLNNISLDAFVDGGEGQRYLDHAVCFFMGDLNYRLNLSREMAMSLISANKIERLLEEDQLNQRLKGTSASTSGGSSNTGVSSVEFAEGASDEARYGDEKAGVTSTIVDETEADKRDLPQFPLVSFKEAPIAFLPTYKYDPGTNNYDTSDKQRVPAWCDRVLYRGGSGSLRAGQQSKESAANSSNGTLWPDVGQAAGGAGASPLDPASAAADIQGQIQPLHYRRYECNLSDHRPISAGFSVTVKSISREERATVAQQ